MCVQVFILQLSLPWTLSCFLCSGSPQTPVCRKEANKGSSWQRCEDCVYAGPWHKYSAYQYMMYILHVAIIFNMNCFFNAFYCKGKIQIGPHDKCMPTCPYTTKTQMSCKIGSLDGKCILDSLKMSQTSVRSHEKWKRELMRQRSIPKFIFLWDSWMLL